jgi:Ca-activated chloride channel family protein
LKDDKRPSYVIFLTDGLPTAGVTPEAKIVERAKSANKVHARIFAFGVGYDVNSRLLDKLVRANFGQSEYVRPNENIEARVSSFYAKVGSPVLTDVKIKFDVDGATTEEGSVVNRMYPSDTFDLFAGQQLVLVGRYRTPGDAKVTVTGNVAGREQSFDFPAKLVESSGDDANGFIEKLWAVRRVGEIIDKIDLGGKNDELVKELVALSTRHGILTPYTAFLAEEDVPLGDVTRNASRAGKNLDALKESAGASGFSQRDEKFRNRSATRAPSDGRVELRDSNDRKVVVDGVQNVGQKSFYLRDGRWTDSTVTDVKDKNVVKIERFSKQYFDLAAKHGSRITRYMALDGPVTVRIDDVTYTW